MDANGSALLLKRLVYVDVAADVAAAWDADVAAAAAMAAVRRRLDDIGVIGPAATFLLASTVADLRLVAAVVLGVDFTDASWNALHLTWIEAEFAGRRVPLQRSRSL